MAVGPTSSSDPPPTPPELEVLDDLPVRVVSNQVDKGRLERLLDFLAVLARDYLIQLSSVFIVAWVSVFAFLASDEGVDRTAVHLGLSDAHKGVARDVFPLAYLLGVVGTAGVAVLGMLLNRTLSDIRSSEQALTNALRRERQQREEERSQLHQFAVDTAAELQEEREAAYHAWAAGLTLILRLIANHHNLDADDRVSLFVHDGKDFLLLARFSQNPVLERRTRRHYPSSHGIVGLAWKRTTAFKRITEVPESNYDKYIERQLEMGLTAEEAQSLTMQSRVYAARRLEKFAVLVFESQKLNGLSGVLPGSGVSPTGPELDDHFLTELQMALRSGDRNMIPTAADADRVEMVLPDESDAEGGING